MTDNQVTDNKDAAEDSSPECKAGSSTRGGASLKVFVGGLALTTTEADLVSYFSKFGDLYSCKCILNPSTGRSRGFGFISFKDERGLRACIDEGVHVITGKPVEVKKAVYKDKSKFKSRYYPNQSQFPEGLVADMGRMSIGGEGPFVPIDYDADITNRKIFIGGLAHNVDSGALASYFERYGEVVDAVVMVDKETERSRGFGFITFASEESAAAAKSGTHAISGKEVEVKSAQPRRAVFPPAYGKGPGPHGERDGLHSYNEPTVYGGSYYYGPAAPWPSPEHMSMFYQGGYPYPAGATIYPPPYPLQPVSQKQGGQEGNEDAQMQQQSGVEEKDV